MKVRFHPLAQRELISAALYIEQEAQLGSEFLNEYEAWEANIRQFPESCPEIGLGIRKGVLKRFKYIVGYKIKGVDRSRSIRILYIRHAAQDSKDWTARS